MPNHISCVLIEDEEKSLALMTNLLEQINQVRLDKAFQDAEEAYNYVTGKMPDLIILDIKMPKMSGLQFIDQLEKQNIYIPFIFVTAYDEYMIDALRRSAVDYLLKPVSLKQLKEAISRFDHVTGEQIIRTVRRKMKSINMELLRFNFKQGFEIVKTAEIIYLEADGRYTKIHLTGGRELTVSSNIGNFEDLISHKNFIRIHRSLTINPLYFKKLNRLVKLCILGYKENEYKLKVSNSGLKALEEFFSAV